MKESDKEHLIKEIAQDLYENPDDARDIFNGLHAGYPDISLEIGLAAIARVNDRKLIESDEFQRSMQELREGKTVEL